ncbi:hypothetical protein BD414DRAFT_421653 [Trametes punicea]|nr:hypothetical protein BD414DRAFT_421653 [Trametes punicea]
MRTHTGWKCPFCDYVQAKERTPDLRRHIATHCAQAALLQDADSSSDSGMQLRCCGVPLHMAKAYGVTDTSKLLVLDGVETVGGCGMTFSRRDALLRHLRNSNNNCVGDRKKRLGKAYAPSKCPKKPRQRA